MQLPAQPVDGTLHLETPGMGQANMTTTDQPQQRAVDDTQGIAAQKRVALNYLSEAWSEAEAEGVAPEIIAHAALFAAFADLVATYGEQAVAELARSLPGRIEGLEFTL